MLKYRQSIRTQVSVLLAATAAPTSMMDRSRPVPRRAASRGLFRGETHDPSIAARLRLKYQCESGNPATLVAGGSPTFTSAAKPELFTLSHGAEHSVSPQASQELSKAEVVRVPTGQWYTGSVVDISRPAASRSISIDTCASSRRSASVRSTPLLDILLDGPRDAALTRTPTHSSWIEAGKESVLFRVTSTYMTGRSLFARESNMLKETFARERAWQRRLGGTVEQSTGAGTKHGKKDEITTAFSRIAQALKHPGDAWDRMRTRARMDSYRKAGVSVFTDA